MRQNKSPIGNKIIALCGNPNVGKSTIFNKLTGLRQHTGNWPGKTVAVAEGRYQKNKKEYSIIDLPGCYSFNAHSPEEEVAREFISSDKADAVVVVCDAVCLERSLILALQALELSKNVVICVNLMDEAKKKKIHIDLKGLEKKLGVPVVGTSAGTGKGLDRLTDTVADIINREKPPEENTYSKNDSLPDKKHNNNEPCEASESESAITSIIQKAELICRETVFFENKNYRNRDSKIDNILTGKLTAFPIMILALMGIFWLTITGANYPSALLSNLFSALENKLILFCQWISLPKFVYEILILGVYRVLSWVVAVMLPPMAIFFPLFTLLEDIGFLPRIAFNMDKYFKKCNACGKQMLTMCMGIGCNAAGVIGCRIIDSPRERLIAIITNNFIPCNGRYPILISIITMFFITASPWSSLLSAAILTLFILIGVFMTFIVSKILSKTILKGMASSFTLELPPYRKPQFGKVIVRSVFDRTLFVLGRAVSVAAPAGLVIWLMANFSFGDKTILLHCSEFLDPFGRLLGMDGIILISFILGFPANEIVIPIMIMSYLGTGNISEGESLIALKQLLTDNGWTWVTAVNVMLFSVLHWPCSTTCLTIKKETESVKWTLLSFLIPTSIGIITCIVFTFITKLL